MTLQEAISYIHSVRWRGSKPGLSRTRALLAKLGNPEKKLKFVHVAGTNGKGSTCAMVSSVLRQAGLRTGLYISPYILRFNERIQVNGRPVPDGELVRLVEEVRPLAESMEDRPTEFELITAVAMQYFARQRCDIVVLEVGLGGELDSTNVIDAPEAAVICAIGLDHTAVLGSSLGEIAAAKAGIIKPGSAVAAYGGVPEADAVLRARCAETGVPLAFVDFDRLRLRSAGLDGCRFDYKDYPGLFVPLAGVYQPKNAALAVETVEILQKRGWPVTAGHLYEGLAHVQWPGRFELLSRRPTVILDGAHNPHGMRATAESLRAQFPGGRFVFLMGVMADKDVDAMLSLLLPLKGCFLTVRPDNPRSMEAGVLAARIRALGGQARACGSVEEGAALALREAGEDGIICALGSLYFSGEVRAAFDAQRRKEGRKEP